MPLQDFILAQSIRFIAYNYLGRHYDEISDQKPRPTIPLIMIHWFTVTSPPGRLATSKLATKGDLATTKSPPVDSPPRVISYIALVTLVTGLLDEIYLSNRRS